MPPPLKFEKFGGQIPAVDERLLPIENAVYAENAFLQSGRIEPLAADILIHTLATDKIRYAFRIPIASPGIDNIPDSFWLEFEDANTFVVRSPVTSQADGGRYYWANSAAPPGYTTRTRVGINDPIHGTAPGTAPPLLLGIPSPDDPPVIGPIVGGAPPTETRAYVYTWVSASFEEGPPSPPGIDVGNTDATWTVTMTAPTTLDVTNRTLTKTRLYRTVVGPGGEVDFFLVVELPIATLTFDDDVPADVVANNAILESVDWTAPPADLLGMVSMPNGMVAGWRSNEVWFCEPYRLHAWPVKYVVGVESPIVGLGTIDQNLMILTSGQPYVATGVHPSVMSLRKVQPLEPCTSSKSIVSSPQGVLYTSYNGLILIGPGGGQNVTESTIRKDEWLRLLNLSTIHASYFMAGYYAYSGATDGVFQSDFIQQFLAEGGYTEVDPPFTVHPPPADTPQWVQQDNFAGTMAGAHIAGEQRLGFMTLTCDKPTFNVMTDLWTGETFVIRDQKVFHVDRREYLPRQSYKWTSKIVQLPYKDNYGAAKIFFDEPLGGNITEYTYFRVFADGKLRMTYPVTKSGKQFLLPSGFKADSYQFTIEGQMMIFNIQVAGSPHELRQT